MKTNAQETATWKVIKKATFLRQYDRLKQQYAQYSEMRAKHEPGSPDWEMVTRWMNRIMSEMMDIENGDTPDFLQQTGAQFYVKRERKKVVVRVRHMGLGRVAFRAEQFQIDGEYDLRLKDDLDLIRFRASARMRERGHYFV